VSPPIVNQADKGKHIEKRCLKGDRSLIERSRPVKHLTAEGIATRNSTSRRSVRIGRNAGYIHVVGPTPEIHSTAIAIDDIAMKS